MRKNQSIREVQALAWASIHSRSDVKFSDAFDKSRKIVFDLCDFIPYIDRTKGSAHSKPGSESDEELLARYERYLAAVRMQRGEEPAGADEDERA